MAAGSMELRDEKNVQSSRFRKEGVLTLNVEHRTLNEKAAAGSMELRDEKNVQSSRFKVQKRGGFNVEHRTSNIERKGGSREHGAKAALSVER